MKPNKEITFKINTTKMPADMFVRVVDSFVTMLSEVSKGTAGPGTVNWNISVDQGSEELIASPEAKDIENKELEQRVVENTFSGIVAIENGDPTRPDCFPEKAYEAYRQISEDIKKSSFSAEFYTDADLENSIKVCRELSAIEQEVDSPTKSYGSVTGEIKQISALNDLYFRIEDELTGAHIKCSCSDKSILIDASKSFSRRVHVYGIIKRKLDGAIDEMQALRIDPIDEDKIIPFSKLPGMISL